MFGLSALAPSANMMDSNMTNESTRTVSYEVAQAVYYTEAVIQPTILAIGILTNSISIYILSGARMPSNLKICIVSLTISDLMATIVGFAQMMVEVIAYDGQMPFGYWQPAAIASYSLYFIFMMFMSTSASLVILLALIRCLLVLKPVASRRFLTSTKTKCLCLGATIGVFFLFIPTLMYVLWQSCYKDLDRPVCSKLYKDVPKIESFVNKYLNFLLFLFGPVLLIVYVVCFIIIRVTLGKSKELVSSMSERKRGEEDQSTRRRGSVTARITRTLLFILLLDTICTVPTVVQGAFLIVAPKVTVISDDNPIHEILDIIAEVFLYMRPAYNFWVYTFTHKEFQHRFKMLVRKVQIHCICLPRSYRDRMKLDELSSSLASRTDSTRIHNSSRYTPPSTLGRPSIKISALDAQARKQLQEIAKDMDDDKCNSPSPLLERPTMNISTLDSLAKKELDEISQEMNSRL